MSPAWQQNGVCNRLQVMLACFGDLFISKAAGFQLETGSPDMDERS
jgi:hypothetical protein